MGAGPQLISYYMSATTLSKAAMMALTMSKPRLGRCRREAPETELKTDKEARHGRAHQVRQRSG